MYLRCEHEVWPDNSPCGKNWLGFHFKFYGNCCTAFAIADVIVDIAEICKTLLHHKLPASLSI